MARWIAFDDATVAAIAAHSKVGADVHTGDPMSEVVSSATPALALMPGENGAVRVIIVHPVKRAQRRVELVATGFLGLTDAPVYEQPSEPGKWWRKIWPR